MDNRLLRASFGTTKYCSFFLKEQKCLNKDWLYLHKWHSDQETYTKEEMANKKIFSDQQEIAIKHSEINVKSREEFAKDWEKNIGPIPVNSRFPSVLQIYDKFSSYDKLKQEIEQTTPKKVSSKIDGIDTNFDSNLKSIEEDKVSLELELSDIKLSKMTKQERLQIRAQIEIENKITEANNLLTIK